MEPWFLRDFARVQSEREAIDALVSTERWVKAYEWHLVDGDLCVDATLHVHDHDYRLRVVLPPLFPIAPAVVIPLGEGVRLSEHQYGGAGGPLCLQWGPDNWHPGLTAADMLKSAYALLEIENPKGTREAPRVVVPSRHHLTIGQELRGKKVRWYSSLELNGIMVAQEPESSGRMMFTLRKQDDVWITFITEVEVKGETWKPNDIPRALTEKQITGLWKRSILTGSVIQRAQTLNDLACLPEVAALAELPKSADAKESFNGEIGGLLVLDAENRPHMILPLNDGELIHFFAVEEVGVDIRSRAPYLNQIGQKRVGIVGAGSAGSKIAVTLARMGVRRLMLVDHDVLLPGNLDRHVLDWQGVLLHKVRALAEALKRLIADIEVETEDVYLGGQESTSVVNGVLARLATCDVIVDATADPRAFNLLSAVAGQASVPMVWLEVFAGGVGGLVGRSRPHLDPAPQELRASYLAYCDQNPAPSEMRVAQEYSMETEALPVVGSDAEVGVIADHAARFIVDCLANPNKSVFPHCLYLVGLRQGWVFEEPFVTIPIVVPSGPTAAGASDVQPPPNGEAIQFLVGLLKKERL
jgi:sulfur-carrier protein adenylyltransferase/sulfurtransferase